MDWKFWKKHDDDLLADFSADFTPPPPPEDTGLDPSLDFPTQGNAFDTNDKNPDPFGSVDAFTPPQNSLTPQGFSQQTAPPVDTSHKQEKQELLQELILARLDSIKNQLDVVNSRLNTIEGKQSSQKRGPWYTKP